MKPCAAWRFKSTTAASPASGAIPTTCGAAGHLCPKGASLGAIHHDPDRIRRPMIKVDGQWQEVSWDAAFRRCTELLAPVIAEHGIGAVTCYTGNPLAHSFSLGRYTGVLLGMSGIPVSYSPGTVDQWPKNLSSHLMYGNWWGFPVPDIERTDLLVVMGANPAASQGSLLAAPDVMGIIGRIDTVIVIDPVRTATAAKADEWLPITPGTDAALLLAVVHTLFDEDLATARPARRHSSTASTTLRQVAADWSPERVAPVTGIGAERIRRPRPPTRRHRAGRRLWPNRPVQPGVRQPGQLARRRRQHPHRALRHARRRDVPAPRGLDRHRASRSPARRRPARVRSLAAPACAAPRRCSARCRCRVWPRRSTRPGDGQIKALDHRRRQPGAVHAGRPSARRGAAATRRHDRRRPMAQRDHPARRRDPAGLSAAGAAAPR